MSSKVTIILSEDGDWPPAFVDGLSAYVIKHNNGQSGDFNWHVALNYAAQRIGEPSERIPLRVEQLEDQNADLIMDLAYAKSILKDLSQYSSVDDILSVQAKRFIETGCRCPTSNEAGESLTPFIPVVEKTEPLEAKGFVEEVTESLTLEDFDRIHGG